MMMTTNEEGDMIENVVAEETKEKADDSQEVQPPAVEADEGEQPYLPDSMAGAEGIELPPETEKQSEGAAVPWDKILGSQSAGAFLQGLGVGIGQGLAQGGFGGIIGQKDQYQNVKDRMFEEALMAGFGVARRQTRLTETEQRGQEDGRDY
jgi:hypothetical protein